MRGNDQERLWRGLHGCLLVLILEDFFDSRLRQTSGRRLPTPPSVTGASVRPRPPSLARRASACDDASMVKVSGHSPAVDREPVGESVDGGAVLIRALRV